MRHGIQQQAEKLSPAAQVILFKKELAAELARSTKYRTALKRLAEDILHAARDSARCRLCGVAHAHDARCPVGLAERILDTLREEREPVKINNGERRARRRKREEERAAMERAVAPPPDPFNIVELPDGTRLPAKSEPSVGPPKAPKVDDDLEWLQKGAKAREVKRAFNKAQE